MQRGSYSSVTLISILTDSVTKKSLIPNFAKIKIPTNFPAAKSTQRKTQNLRVKDEIKYLCMKKQQLNCRLYHLHLSLILVVFWLSVFNPKNLCFRV